MRRWFPLVMLLAIATGYLAGEAVDRASVWTTDQGLFDRSGVRPAALPDFQPGETRGPQATGLRFEAMEDSGITFSYDNGPEGQFHLAETLGGGVAVINLDHDAAPDLIFVDGGDPVRWPASHSSRLHLYRQSPTGPFTAVSEPSGLEWTGYGHGVAIADVNSDGFDDLLVTGYEQSAFFLGLGDGTFVEEPHIRKLAGERWCASACWADLDTDGDLDCYITCYAVSPRTMPTPLCESRGVRIHCNPHSYGRLPDILLENLGDGTFSDRSQSSGIAEYQEYGLGVTAGDLDGDGVVELFVANDGDRNLLFRRTGDWTYEDVAQQSGVAFNGQGGTMGSMGIACVDFDNNGRLDLLTTNFSNESNALFRQVGPLVFMDGSQGTTLEQVSRPLVGWAAIPFDADCDGWTDLFVANGHVTRMPNEDWAQLPTLLRGTPESFQEAGNAGEWFERHWHARGASRVDLNRDGLDDLVVGLIKSPAAILLNRSSEVGQRVQLQLIGTTSPRSAEGAVVEVEQSTGTRVFLVSGNGGYLSTNSAIVTIGLGQDVAAKRIRIRWPGGAESEFRDVPAGGKLLITEGREHPQRSPLQTSPE